ncbi:ATP-dependent DNA helicase PIF1 [Fusarium oxysporum f. sp. raphani]|uniref:ATP-dependent DNA helicase n=2 Tax=Fusarium oxysporum f. sp. raphani TaxID=96318 RepID=A0A8J5NR91_FUSOX|nr:ATP-dependent DNA helicase PIF1 [Fusarium oxysporum f. sp. raphani]
MQVRGQQYKYRGHIVHFLRDVGKVYRQLPLLPSELDVILLRPPNASEHADLDRQFRRQFASGSDLVPDLLPEDTEMEALHSRILGEERDEPVPVRQPTQHQLEMPDIRRTPVNEFNRSQALLSMAFPTLFPRGQADFVEPRLRPIKYADYIQHALRWHDGRFARHPTFRFVVFNTLMRAQARAKSSYFVKQHHQRRGPITRDDLLEAFQTLNRQMPSSCSTRLTARQRSFAGHGRIGTASVESLSLMPTTSTVPEPLLLSPRLTCIGGASTSICPSSKTGRSCPSKQRMGMSSKLLGDNPTHCSLALLQAIRYEWQGRGSSHCHGLFWMDGAPSVDLENELTPWGDKSCLTSHTITRFSLCFASNEQVACGRDFSGQEICHVLLNCELQEGTRVVRAVDCRPYEQQGRSLRLQGDHDDAEVVGIYDNQLEYNSNRQHDQYDDFCRVKLMLAHPHRDPNQLRKVNGVGVRLYALAAEFCYGNHQHPDDYYGTPNTEERRPDPDQFEREFHEPDLVEEDWLELARQLPDCPPSQEAMDLLGRRDIDIQYDWTPHVGRYADPGIVQGDYWRQRIEQDRLDMDVEDLPLEVRDTLNPEQRIVYDTFVGHFQCGSEEQILLHVDGGGGTGKSYMIKVLSSHLQRLAGDRPSPIWRAAPTGVASNQIMGTTLHSLLRLPVDRAFTELSPADANAIQKKLRDVRYLVIDEKSMLGLRQLSWVDKRLRQVFPGRAADFFGGMSIILVGDFFQLPPVANKPLYFDGPLKDLHEVERQQGDDQAGFRLALEELRGLRLSIESWKLLSQRVQAKLSQCEVDKFDTTLRIYSKKARVNEYNYDHLVRLKQPAIQVMAKNIGNGADKATSEQAGNLAGQFPVCIGARLMITQNIWQPAGLVNGAQGIVYDIGWAPGADTHRDPPREVVPILPVKRDFFLGTSACTRKQFPLTVSYAITVHKSQSITVDKMVTDLSERDFQTGLSYVAVSRVKMLEGLMIDAPFERASLHYDKLPDGVLMKVRDQDRRRQQQLDQPLFHPLFS